MPRTRKTNVNPTDQLPRQPLTPAQRAKLLHACIPILRSVSIIFAMASAKYVFGFDISLADLKQLL